MRILFTLLVIGVTTYAVIDCVRTEDERRPGIPTWAWVVMILFLQPLVGAVVWLLVSRLNRNGQGPSRQYRKPVAPDDDPDFLRYLQERSRRERRKKEKDPEDPAADN